MLYGLIVNVILMLAILLACKYRVVRNREGRIIFKKVRNPLSILVLAYLFSAIAALIYDPSRLPGAHIERQSSSSYFIYSLLLAIGLVPVLNNKRLPIREPLFQKTSSINAGIIGAALMAWYAALYLLPFAIKGFALGAGSVKGSGFGSGLALLPANIFTTFAVVVASCYALYIAMFFICVINRFNLLITYSMLLGSVTMLINQVAQGNRAAAVMFLAMFIFCYYVFKDWLDRRSRRRVRIMGVALGMISAVVLIAFTLQRFGGGGRAGVGLSGGTLAYIGMQPYTFAEVLSDDHGVRYGIRQLLPLFYGGNDPFTAGERIYPFEWQFGTYLMNLYLMYGQVSLFIGAIVVPTFFMIWMRKRDKKQDYAYLLAYLLYFQFMIEGVFYLMLGSRGGNLYILIVIMLYWATRVLVKRRRVKCDKVGLGAL